MASICKNAQDWLSTLEALNGNGYTSAWGIPMKRWRRWWWLVDNLSNVSWQSKTYHILVDTHFSILGFRCRLFLASPTSGRFVHESKLTDANSLWTQTITTNVTHRSHNNDRQTRQEEALISSWLCLSMKTYQLILTTHTYCQHWWWSLVLGLWI